MIHVKLPDQTGELGLSILLHITTPIILKQNQPKPDEPQALYLNTYIYLVMVYV